MTTKQQTTQTTAFNQPSMTAFNTMTPVASQGLLSNINDPYNNMFFNTQLGMQQAQNQAYGSSGQSAINQSLLARGIGANSPMAAFLSRQNSMNTASMNAGTYNNLLLNAANLRQSSIGAALNYRPLATGGTTTQQMGGTGSWLPQLAGTAIGAAGAAFGMPMGGGGSMANTGGAAGTNAWAAGNYGGSPFLQTGSPMGSSFTPGMGGYGASFDPGQGYWNSMGMGNG